MSYTSVGSLGLPNPLDLIPRPPGLPPPSEVFIPPTALAPGAAANITDQQLALLALTSPGAAAALVAKREYDRGAKQGFQQQQAATSTQIAMAQGYLIQLRLYSGPVNGVMDNATQFALDTFRKAASIAIGGGVTDADLKALKAAADAASSSTGGAGLAPGSLFPGVLSGGSAAGLPSWALPVGIGVAGLLLILAFRR